MLLLNVNFLIPSRINRKVIIMLIDMDSKPSDTILYLSARLLLEIKRLNKVNIASIDDLFYDIDSTQPPYKFYLSLNFLYLMDKVRIEEGELLYVS
ncbi:ABC-three component system middle component 6 [Halalkalibacter suaedae]|uniref:ABC-three component system middle component 6 n=1 Tax=Halalkalibacter suaedae TaxID=2822140 RepID=UPI003AF06883